MSIRFARALAALACLLGGLGLAAAGATARAEDAFFFQDGDTVVMIGDSITEQHLYSNYVEMFTVTRFPAWNLTFRNTGIGGDRSPGGNNRFARDVASYKPTAMTVDFGMNDGGYKAFDEAGFKTYVAGLQGMADKAKAASVRVAWITPQPLDGPEQGTTALTGYNLTLQKYSAGVGEIAKANDGLFVDQFHPYLAALDKARAASDKYERITAGDAVHPGPPGQALMAAAILQGMLFPPLVSALEIDAAASQVTAAKNCEVKAVAAADGGLKFTRADQALPFFPAEAMSILKWAPLLTDLNQYTLKVTGLPSGDYEIRVDDAAIATRSDAELAAGVNLAEAALQAGPIAEQVKKVKAAIEAKNRFHHDRIFRGVVLSNASIPDWLGLKPEEVEAKKQAALRERFLQLADLDAAVRKTVEMKPRAWTIAPVKAK